MSALTAAPPRNVRLLYLHNFLCDFRPQAAFLIIYFNQVTGSYAQAMAVLSIEMLAAVIMDIPLGMLSDHVGRKYTIGIGSLLYTAAIGCYGLATGWVGLAAGAALFGTARCFFTGNNDAMLYESLKAEGREGDFHHFHARADGMFQLALGLSAIAGGLLSSHGLAFVFLLGTVPQALSVLVCFFFHEPRVRDRRAPRGLAHLKAAFLHAFRNKRLRLLIIGQALNYGAGESSFSFVAPFVNSLWPTWAVGWYRAFNHACGFAGFWFAGRIIEHLRAPRVLWLGEAFMSALSWAGVLLSNIASPVLMSIGAAGFGPYTVACDKLLQEEFTDDQRATLGSVASFTGSILYALFAPLIGLVADRFGIAAGLCFGYAFCSLSLPVFIRLFRRHF